MTMTREQARGSARKIKEYWKGRGYEVRTWVEESATVTGVKREYSFNVRSDLVGGLPRELTPAGRRRERISALLPEKVHG